MADELSRLDLFKDYVSRFEHIFKNDEGEETEFCLSNSHISDEQALQNYISFRTDVDSYTDEELGALTTEIHSIFKDGKKVPGKVPSKFNAKEHTLRTDLLSYTDSQLNYFRGIKAYFADMHSPINAPVDYESFLERHKIPENYFVYIQDRKTYSLYNKTYNKLASHDHPKTTKAINNILKKYPTAARPDEKVISIFLIALIHRIALQYHSPIDKQIIKIINKRNKSRKALLRASVEPQILHGLLKEPLLNMIGKLEGANSKEALEAKASLDGELEEVEKSIELFTKVMLNNQVTFGPVYRGGSGRKKNHLFNEIIDLVVDFYTLLTGEVPPKTKDGDGTHNSLYKKLLKAIFLEIYIGRDILDGNIEGSKETARYIKDELDEYLPYLVSLHNEFSGKSLQLSSMFMFSLQTLH